MITIFNRQELITTFSMDVQAGVRDTLTQNGIEYRIKTHSHSFGRYARKRTGSCRVNSEYAYEYIIYVHRDDLEKAQYLISK